MSNRIKEHLDNFDVSLLDTYENVLYNELRRDYPHRLSLIKLIMQHKPQSYALDELKQLLNEYDKDIRDYE